MQKKRGEKAWFLSNEKMKWNFGFDFILFQSCSMDNSFIFREKTSKNVILKLIFLTKKTDWKKNNNDHLYRENSENFYISD